MRALKGLRINAERMTADLTRLRELWRLGQDTDLLPFWREEHVNRHRHTQVRRV
jgi:hypothetical protein